MSALSTKHCVPCKGGVPTLTEDKAAGLLEQLRGWEIVDNHHLAKNLKFPDFKTALAFVNRVGELAERENHHPELFLSWGKVRIELCTHKVNGLTENDFVLAAKIDALPQS